MSAVLPPTAQLEATRKRALDLLAAEKRPMHTGEIALLLKVPTHEVHLAMHEPHCQQKVWFTASTGWELPAKSTPLRMPEDGQTQLT